MATNNPGGPAPRRKRTPATPVLETPSTNGVKLPSAGTPRKATVLKATSAAKAPKTAPVFKTSVPRKKKKVIAEPESEHVVFVSLPPVPPSEPIVLDDSGGPVAERFIASEIIRARLNLRYTQIVGTVVTLIGAVSLLTITNGFANNLKPATAAVIANGMISDHMDEWIPQVQQQIRDGIPEEIGKVPDYAKEQLPKYRQTLENNLEKSIQNYATQTAPQLSQQVDSFLATNKEAVRSMIQTGGSSQDTTDLGNNMKLMFASYLNTTSIAGETLKSKVDSTLSDLASIDARVGKMAANKNLTDNEKRGRRAIAILLRSVDENPQLQQAALAIQSIDTTPVTGALQWKSEDEAVFTAPGKAPMVFQRKKDVVAQPSAKVVAKTTAPATVKPSKPSTTPVQKTGQERHAERGKP